MAIPEPFKLKVKKAVKGHSIANTMQRRPVRGDIGLEIEVEGNKFRKETGIPSPWTYHKDGSLRGHDNAEYVLGKPIAFSEVNKAIADLWAMFKVDGSVLDHSNRTSVHVHLNFQRFFLNRLTSFLGLYFSVEELLTEWCGDHRVGNLFCLRAKDATAIVTALKRFISSDCQTELKDGLHYSGMNAQALVKFGSLEFRALRGVTEPQPIIEWVGMLRHIYELSERFTDPREIPGLLSSEGPMSYLDMVLGEWSPVLKKGIAWDVHRIRDSLYEGIRMAQDLCYCRDWDLYLPGEHIEDPFGRTKTKTSGMIANAISQQTAHSMAFDTYLNTATMQPPPMPAPPLATPAPGYIPGTWNLITPSDPPIYHHPPVAMSDEDMEAMFMSENGLEENEPEQEDEDDEEI